MFRKKTDCQRVREMLSEYIDGRFSAKRKLYVEGHLEGCQGCSQELESLRATVGLLRGLSPAPLPRSFHLAQPAPRPLAPGLLRPGLLRLATAVATLLLVFFLVSDFLQIFEPEAVPQGGPQALLETPQARAVEEVAPKGVAPAPPPPGEEGGWPLRELEIAFGAVTALLLGLTIFASRRARKGGERGYKRGVG